MDSLSKLSRLRLGMLEFLPEQRKTNWCHHVNKACMHTIAPKTQLQDMLQISYYLEDHQVYILMSL